MANSSIARRTLNTLLRRQTATTPIRSNSNGAYYRRQSHLFAAVSASSPPQQPVTSARWFSDKTTGTEELPKEEEEAAAAEGEGGATKEATTPEEEEKEPVVSKTDELEAQVKELKDQLLRSLAEQENTRRIAQRDIQSAKDFSIKSFAKALLDVSDNLTRALDAVPQDHRDDKEGHKVLATLYEGIQMTDAGLSKAFQSSGLVKFGTDGEAFDPNLHEALFEYPDPEKEAGTIGQIMKPGFMLNKRVLRPAEVGVVKK